MYNGIVVDVRIEDLDAVRKAAPEGSDTIRLLAFENGAVVQMQATDRIAFLKCGQKVGKSGASMIAGHDEKNRPVHGTANLCTLHVVPGSGFVASRRAEARA